MKGVKEKCIRCGKIFDSNGASGRRKRTCSNACRQALYRKRKAEKASKIPKEMTSRAQWVRADGKRPLQVSGSFASSTNPATWAEFRQVQKGAGDGYGVMLGNGLGCVDIDHCFIGGRLQGWARKVVEAIHEPILFIERSLSGEGLHIFIEAPEAKGTKRGQVERYTRQRFIRMTGDAFVM